jgi:hypothetical protein
MEPGWHNLGGKAGANPYLHAGKGVGSGVAIRRARQEPAHTRVQGREQGVGQRDSEGEVGASPYQNTCGGFSSLLIVRS